MVITAVTETDRTDATYNLTVADLHTHIVGKSGSVANLTQYGHLLHRGYVIRWSEQRADGSIVMRTLGRGTGFAGGLNSFFGRRIFNDLDNRAQRVYNYRKANR